MSIKRITLLVSFALLILGVAGMAKQIMFAQDFPQVEDVFLNESSSDKACIDMGIVQANSNNSFDGLFVDVGEMEFLSVDELKDRYPNSSDQIDKMQSPGRSVVYALVPLKFTCAPEMSCTIYLPDVQLESDNWSMFMEPTIFGFANDLSLQIDMTDDEVCEVMMTYEIVDEGFTQEEWNEVENRNYSLGLFFYPNKYVIRLD